MRNLERFLSKQMYPYLSLVEGKVAELYHNIDRRSWLVWIKMTYFHGFFRTIPGVLDLEFITAFVKWNFLVSGRKALRIPVKSQRIWELATSIQPAFLIDVDSGQAERFSLRPLELNLHDENAPRQHCNALLEEWDMWTWLIMR